MDDLYPGGRAAIWEEWELAQRPVPPRIRAPAAAPAVPCHYASDSGSDSDDVDEAAPAFGRSQAALRRAALDRFSAGPAVPADACMLECYMRGVHPLPLDWPPEPRIAQRFYSVAPAWAQRPELELEVALVDSPFQMLPDDVLQIVLIFSAAKTLLSDLPVVCRKFGALARRETFWISVCRLRSWCAVGPPGTAIRRHAHGRLPR
jgi:hypothetical protein